VQDRKTRTRTGMDNVPSPAHSAKRRCLKRSVVVYSLRFYANFRLEGLTATKKSFSKAGLQMDIPIRDLCDAR
jgi:hypothetical protein